MRKIIGIVGDYNNHIAQSTIADSIEHSNKLLNLSTDFEWISTEMLNNENYEILLKKYNGIWSAPGSPVKHLNGVINSIRYAREKKIPYLGTCAGYQHTIIEYARNVAGFKNAQHAEYSDDLDNQFISKMSCSLQGTKAAVILQKGSKVSRIFGSTEIEGHYFCNYGLDTKYTFVFTQSNFLISGHDTLNEIRILELKNHPFFIATVFVPQVNSTAEKPNNLITEFLRIING